MKRGPLGTLVLRTIINAGALFVAAELISGIHYDGLQAILLAAMVFGLINALIRPLTLVVTCLINVLTLGLFTLVVNALMLLLTSWFAEQLSIGFHVESFWAAFWGAIIISIASWALSRFVR